MKKQILALALVLSAFSVTFANNNPSTSTLKLSSNETSFIVDLTAFEGKANLISVADEKGNLVFSDNIASNNQRIKYILDRFQAGTYSVKIKGDETVEYYSIIVDRNSVSLIEKKTYSSPTIVQNANKIIVQSTDTNQNKLSFSVFDSDGKNIYRKAGFSQKAFILDELDHGDYRVIVRDGEFSKELFVSL